MVVTIPVLLITGLLATLGWAFVGSAFLGIVIGIAAGWLGWSFTISRWRDWAIANGLQPGDVQDLAARTGLVWPRGSWVERTEFRRANGKRGW
jgi:hypothetical protein